MPKLQELTVKKRYLPSFPKNDPAWIMLETPTKIDDFKEIQHLDEIDQVATLISRKIKKWNLEDKDGRAAKVNAENVRCLNATDYAFLVFELGLQKMMTLLNPAKKKS